MTIQGWEQVKELLHQAMQLAPEQRAQFLDKPCSSDIALRAEVESLLLAGEYVHSGSCNRHRCAPIQIAPTRSLPWNRDRSSPSISNLPQAWRRRNGTNLAGRTDLSRATASRAQADQGRNVR
jgi:hypothetical protein